MRKIGCPHSKQGEKSQQKKENVTTEYIVENSSGGCENSEKDRMEGNWFA